MEEFQINLSIEGLPEEIRVVPFNVKEDESRYELYHETDFLGTVWPECVEAGVCWFSSDEISEDTVLKIGEAIERADR